MLSRHRLARVLAARHVDTMMCMARLADRGVIEVTGGDRVTFLNGLVSNDVAAVAPGRAVWAALLTPQGKFVADFFILAHGPALLLDCAGALVGELVQKLSRYRLRADVALRALDWAVQAAWDESPAVSPEVAAAPDPRLPEAGWRVLSPLPLPTTAEPAAYERHRIALGLPDGTRDLEPGKTVLLEAGFDELSGVSWTKGCYLGQELTARTKYRGLVKQRLVPVAIEGEAVPGTAVTDGGQEVGVLRSVAGDAGLASLRLAALSSGATGGLRAGAASLSPRVPAWMRLPEKPA